VASGNTAPGVQALSGSPARAMQPVSFVRVPNGRSGEFDEDCCIDDGVGVETDCAVPWAVEIGVGTGELVGDRSCVGVGRTVALDAAGAVAVGWFTSVVVVADVAAVDPTLGTAADEEQPAPRMKSSPRKLHTAANRARRAALSQAPATARPTIFPQLTLAE
jgi:hypothetical protein